jgi:hypothetical protein
MNSTDLTQALKRFWGRLSRRARRVFVVSVACPVLMLLTATAAYADGSTAPSTLSWMKIKDSSGISVWKYELSVDGGGVTSPGKLLWSSITGFIWESYRAYVAISIWLIDWVLSFDWLDTVSAPMLTLGDNLTVIVNKFGLVPTLLTITAIASVLWMARGRWVLGLFELFLSLIIASLAVGALANPIGLVAGNDGMLIQSRDFGLAVSSGLVNGGDTNGSSEDMRKEVSATLADTFIRQPTQMINFGRVVDGTDCEDDWEDVVKDGPYGEDDDVRSAMGDCDDAMKDVADNPNSAMAMSAAVLFPAAFIVLLFAAILAGTVLVAGVQALYRGLKLILDLVLGLLPGSARGSLWMSIADLVMALVTVVFSVVFLTAYLLLIQAIFASGGTARMETFFFVDILLIVGIVVYWRGRARIKAAAERLAQALATRPGGGGASSLPGRNKFNPTEVYYKGRMALAGAQMAGAGAMALGSAAGSAAASTGKAAAAAGRTAARPVRDSMDRIRWASGVASQMNDQQASTQQQPPAELPASQRVHKKLNQPKPSMRGQLVRLGTNAAMAYASGGTSVVTTAVARTARQQATASIARRAALTQRLHPPALPAGPSSSGPGARPASPAPVGGGAPAAQTQTPKPGRTIPSSTVQAAQTAAAARPSSGTPTHSGYDRVETNGTVALVPRRPQQPPTAHTSPAVPSAARPAPTTGDANQRLQSRLAERRNRAIALPPPKHSGN